MNHTEKYTGFKEDDIVIWYSKTKDFNVEEPCNNDLLVPLFVCIDLVNETRGIHMPITTFMGGSAQELKDLALHLFKGYKFDFNKTKFYFKYFDVQKGMPCVNGMMALQKGDGKKTLVVTPYPKIEIVKVQFEHRK